MKGDGGKRGRRAGTLRGLESNSFDQGEARIRQVPREWKGLRHLHLRRVRRRGWASAITVCGEGTGRKGSTCVMWLESPTAMHSRGAWDVRHVNSIIQSHWFFYAEIFRDLGCFCQLNVL